MKLNGCEFPDGLLYHPDGMLWARPEGQKFRLGITSILSWLSGGFTSVSFKPEGARVEMGKALGSVEGHRHFDLVRAPFDCVVISNNDLLVSDPGLLNRDNYGRGWFSLVEPLDYHPTSQLLGSEAARDILASSVKELAVHCFSAYPDFEMFEIGVECSAVLVKLEDLISSCGTGTVVHVVSDDPTADVEMQRWVERTGNQLLESRQEGSIHHFIVRKV